MNFYSDPRFCAALRAGYFPGRQVEQRRFELNQQIWQIPVIDQTWPLPHFPMASAFVDFFEPCISPESIAASEITANATATIPLFHDGPALDYLPRVSHGLVSAEVWSGEAMAQQYTPAPTVLWQTVPSWESFQAKRRKIFSNVRRLRRKLEQDQGPIRLTFADANPDTLLGCMALKSLQYQATGEVDAFARPEHVRFFQALLQQEMAMVASLYVGDRLTAAHICAVDQQRLYSWVPAYDPALRNYAPGRLLLTFLLQESYERGYKEFDFLIGNESYKWDYATHARLIDELGQPPLLQQMMRSLKTQIKPILKNQLKMSPTVKSQLKAMAMWFGV